jgi:PAS domain S-box-containing protein
MRLNYYSNEKLLDGRNGFYEKLLDQIPDLIFQLTISSSNEFHFNYINDSVITFFNLNELELNLNPIEILTGIIHPDDRDTFYRSIYISKNKTKNWSHEFRIITKNKKMSWLKADAKVFLDNDGGSIFYGSLTDITNIKKKEARVSQSEERFHFALQASKNGIWDYNIKTGKIFFSKESLDIIQYTKDDEIETNADWDARIHPDDIESYNKNVDLLKKNNIAYFENTKRILAKDGSYRWVLSRGKIIERDYEGNPVRIIGTHTDVSIEKEKERELLRNLEVINQQNDRLLNFAHIVSHNLRSHTGNIKMLLNLIDEDSDKETKDEYLEHLKTTSDSLNETIEHLKELVDIHSNIIHKKEFLSLSNYLNQTLNLLNNDIKENRISIINTIDSDFTIKYNPAYLESLFLNFTTNSIKYSSSERDSFIKYSAEKVDDKIILSITDNGLGIDLNKNGEKLFGMYKTFHKNENARGIGLFITKNQIESMGGTIEVMSKVNIGTTFKIIFNNEV